MKRKDERGAVILESTYCILASILVLMFFLSFGMLLYQNTVVTVVANEVAEEVSQTYKLRNVSDSASVTAADISGIGKYRYLFFTDSFNSRNEAKAESLATVRLSKGALAKEDGNLSVDVETVTDDIGRRHYEVTVSQKYSFLLGDLLSLVGQNGTQTIEKTAYVESSDVLSYINTVKVTKYGIDKVTENSSALGLIDSAISLLQSVFDD